MVVEESGERLWEAELYRLTGELLLHQTVPDAQHAEACFYQALATARRQQAKSLELRAAMSLARLWQRQGKRGSAGCLLRSMAGSARGLIPPTCGRPRRVRRTDVKSYYRRFSKAVALIRRRGTDRMRGKIGTKVE